MKILRNTPFVIWFYSFLRTIEPIRINIKRYRKEGNLELERQEIRRAEDAWGDALIKKAGIDLEVSGALELPVGPVVFVSNHQSYWDIPVFFAAIKMKQFGFVAKEDLGKIPGFGKWIADIRSVFIIRDDARASLRAIEEGVKLLGQGFSLVIFPEGTRSKGPEMGEFKKGSLRLATKAQVPIIPITLGGTYRAFEEKGYVTPAKVKFEIHPPVYTSGLTRKEASSLPEKVESIIRKSLQI